MIWLITLTRRSCWLLPLLLAFPVRGWTEDSPLALRLAPAEVKQGGVATLAIIGAAGGDRLYVAAGGRKVPVGPLQTGRPLALLLGIDLERPAGPLDVSVEGFTITGRPVMASAQLMVLDAAFPVQRLALPRTFTDLDQGTLERVNREKAVLDRLWEMTSPDRLWRFPFRLPLDNGTRPTGFGLRRIINGEPRAPHSGADLAAPAGAPVFASNAGTVALAEEQFFAGKALVLDHGQGLYTMYFHLEAILVRPGQRVGRGELVARVGSSGRATGPHLHWGARLNGARINPEGLLHLAADESTTNRDKP